MSPVPVPPAAHVLVGHLGDGRPLPAELGDVERWLTASAAFRAFVAANRDKIRRKVRLATTPDTRLDLRAELRVAALLLGDRRFELAFEAYGSGNRGPDFTATFRGGRAVNVEVTRRHAGTDALDRVILGKLRQLPPGAPNVLVVAVEDAVAPPDPSAAMRELRGRADRRDDAFFAARGATDATAFNQGVLRLGAVLAWSEGPAGGAVAAWPNPGARIGVPVATLRAIVAALGDGPQGRTGTV